jgi:uncharacterized protein
VSASRKRAVAARPIDAPAATYRQSPPRKPLKVKEKRTPFEFNSLVSNAPVLIDSGPLFALFDQRDAWHARVVVWLKANPKVTLVTTWSVLTEASAFLARRVHQQAALDLLRWAIRGGLTVDSAPQESLVTVLSISERFADLPFDLADASVAEAASRLRIRRILTIDADFEVYRDHDGRVLQNMLA